MTIAKPVVIVVGADKGGVGKTTISRTLLDYFVASSIPCRAFDTESPRGTLKRFNADITEIVDLTSTTDQMKIFDSLAVGAPTVTVIDVRAGVMSTALESLKNIGFLDMARSGSLTFAVFHVLGSSIASLDEIAATATYMSGVKYCLVKNHVSNNTFFEWDTATFNSYFNRIQDAVGIDVPQLDPMAFEQVEVASLSFVQYIGDTKQSFVLRGHVRHWLGNVWKEFDKIRLAELVGMPQVERRP
jgi:hypothetical protein